ncbi:MAG: beta-ketoacyl-ACP synthase II [Tissierellia bacterium]|nr:beta-ketoacyl-ACP synthase II [Tissierellia bacterium]
MNRVVVTGLGIISPTGNDIETFWNNLEQGNSAIGELTKFDTTDFKVKVAAEVKDFDAKDWLSPAEFRKMDIYCQYAMAAAQQAVDQSGIHQHVQPERLGVYVGSGIGGMTTLLKEYDVLKERGPNRVSSYFIPMQISNMASGNIAVRFGARGPTLPVVTACATSASCIGEAYREIKWGEADAIIAGGAEASILPLSVAGFTNMQALTQETDPKLACLPFDKRRAGFVMSEGAGILVLENYDHAMARGADILGEIVGYGNTCDAFHMTAPHPDGDGIRRAMEKALEGIEYKNKIYVNAHGTGTPLNDMTEIKAIASVFDRDEVIVSSTKSMTGHMLGAAGAAEAIACIQALKHQIIPPTVGLEQPDDGCVLDCTPLTARPLQFDTAISLSLGFGGHNVALVIKGAEA